VNVPSAARFAQELRTVVLIAPASAGSGPLPSSAVRIRSKDPAVTSEETVPPDGVVRTSPTAASALLAPRLGGSTATGRPLRASRTTVSSPVTFSSGRATNVWSNVPSAASVTMWTSRW